MRLLNTKSFELEKFSYDAIPRQYAILSHIWGKEEDEIHFLDVQEGRIKEAQSRPTKLEGCCKIARDDGYEYIWVDTCCIDNKNSVELQEAINSMFRWYENAAICYAFLSDVPANDRNPWDLNSRFSSSRWFERGWTLQELLAPPRLRFYNSEWHYLGTKGELCAIVEKATGIPSPHLLGVRALRDASVAQRMSWAAKRITKMPEDIAYSLLGIFCVAMPMIYGEGCEKAFARLQELIMKEIGDDSILAWGLGHNKSASEPLAESPPGCALARSPADFAECAHIQARERITRDSFDKFGGSLRLRVPLFKSTSGSIFGILKCGDSDRVVGVPLVNISNDASHEYIRPQGCHPILVPRAEAVVSPTAIVVRTEHEDRTLAASSRQYWFNVQRSIEIGLELIDVEPRSHWRKEEALIEATVVSQEDTKQRTFVRFRHETGEAHDFLVAIELRIDESQSQVDAKCHVMICARDTSLGVVARNYSRFRPEVMNKQSASNGMLNLLVNIEIVQEGTMFFLRTVPLDSPPEITYDATVELQILDASMEMIVLKEDEIIKESETATLRKAFQVGKEYLNQTTEELELVKRELSELEAKKAQLVLRCKELGEEVDRLDQTQKTAMALLDKLAERRSSTQWRLESLSNKLAPIILTGDGDDESEAGGRLSILSWAVQNGNLGYVRRLLDMGAVDIEIKSGPDKRTPLHLAAFHGHHKIALMLIELGAKVDSRDKFGGTPLFDALQAKMISILLDYGADINSRDHYGENRLYNALRVKDEQAVSLLVQKGANISLQNFEGRQPLHLAAKYGVDTAVGLFLEKGIDIEAVDNNSSTALHAAAEHGKNSIADILIKNGALVNARNKDSQTPLHLAAWTGHEAISKLLIKSSADVNAKDESALTPLHYACYYGHLAVARLLVQEDANIEAKANSEETPLAIAVKSEHRDIVKLLVATGASMASGKDGLSPLHWAASKGNEAIMKTLLNSGGTAVLNQPSKSGKLPLDCALTNNHEGAAKLLSSHSAIKSSKGTNNDMSVQLPKRSSIVQSSVPIGNRNVVHSSAVAAGQQSLAAHTQVKSPTGSFFNKALKRRKAM